MCPHVLQYAPEQCRWAAEYMLGAGSWRVLTTTCSPPLMTQHLRACLLRALGGVGAPQMR